MDKTSSLQMPFLVSKACYVLTNFANFSLSSSKVLQKKDQLFDESGL